MIQLLIYNANYGQREAEDDDPVNVFLNDTEKKILEAIIQNPQTTYDELASLAQKTRKTVMRNIGKLKEKKLIERVGSDKSGLWKILR